MRGAPFTIFFLMVIGTEYEFLTSRTERDADGKFIILSMKDPVSTVVENASIIEIAE